ncbi:MAG: hypothetical protein C4576_30510 [Desulfobacteraceae bacterium]|nr:MAG: hypothetical protein C4576_30510 [Desulfobacteraceae bacterium]
MGRNKEPWGEMAMETHPLPAQQVIERSFLENRAMLLEIASFLDRLDRAGEPQAGKSDFRYVSLRTALKILSDTSGAKTQRILQIFSDQSTTPLSSANGLKAASGAWRDIEDH